MSDLDRRYKGLLNNLIFGPTGIENFLDIYLGRRLDRFSIDKKFCLIDRK